MTKPAQKPFRERIVFDGATGRIMDDTRRYMMIRPEALMGVFTRLPPHDCAMALQAFMASVAQQGGDSAQAYRRMGDAEPSDLLRTISGTAPDLGWGVWTFELKPRRLVLTVSRSPFAEGFGPSRHPVCHAITGMVRAVAGIVFERPVTAEETRCAAMGAPDCRFEAVPA